MNTNISPMNYLDLLPCDVMEIVLNKRADDFERSLYILENKLCYLTEDLKELQIIKNDTDEDDEDDDYEYSISYGDISYSCEEYLFNRIGHSQVVFIDFDGDFISDIYENPTYYEALKEANEYYIFKIEELETKYVLEDGEEVLEKLEFQLDFAKNHRFLEGFQVITHEKYEKEQGYKITDCFDNCQDVVILEPCFGS